MVRKKHIFKGLYLHQFHHLCYKSKDSLFSLLCDVSWKSAQHCPGTAGGKENSLSVFPPALPATPDPILLL